MITLKLSSMQVRQFQSVNRQFRTFYTSFLYPIVWGTIWVAIFVRFCLFDVFLRSQKAGKRMYFLLLLFDWLTFDAF